MDTSYNNRVTVVKTQDFIVDAEIGFERIAETLGELIFVFQKKYTFIDPGEIIMSDRMFWAFDKERMERGEFINYARQSFRGIKITVDPYIKRKSVILKKEEYVKLYH